MYTPIRSIEWTIYTNSCSRGFNPHEEKDFYEYVTKLKEDENVSREKYRFILIRKLQDEFISYGFRKRLEEMLNEAK